MRNLVLIIFVSLCTSLSGAFAESRVKTTLPVYPPKVTVVEVDESGNEIANDNSSIKRRGRFKALELSILIQDDSETVVIPKDFYEALSEVKLMLPMHYYKFLIKRFGYVPSPDNIFRHRNLRYSFDDRILDLSKFLHDIWDLGNPNHQLGRQFECIGTYDNDLTPFFVMLASNEAFSADGAIIADMDAANIVTEKLLAKCL